MNNGNKIERRLIGICNKRFGIIPQISIWKDTLGDEEIKNFSYSNQGRKVRIKVTYEIVKELE